MTLGWPQDIFLSMHTVLAQSGHKVGEKIP